MRVNQSSAKGFTLIAALLMLLLMSLLMSRSHPPEYTPPQAACEGHSCSSDMQLGDCTACSLLRTCSHQTLAQCSQYSAAKRAALLRGS